MPPQLSIPDLQRFLFAAKLATYAAQGDAASVPPVLPDSRQLEYTDGGFLYRDIYVGMFHFVGQEIVYFSSRAVWSMSYSGGLLPDVESSYAGPVYAFLRKALRALPPELPLRGPALLEEEDMRYSRQCTGSVERFHGSEAVTKGGIRLYELNFAGCLVY
jgi:hypothetical protein